MVWVVNDATLHYSESGTSFRQALFFKEIGFCLFDTMIWCKDGGGSCGSNLNYVQNTEYMFVLSKGRPKAVNLIRDHPNRFAGVTTRLNHGRRKKGDVGRDESTETSKTRTYPEFSKRNNWWVMPRPSSEKGRVNTGHPAPFPLQLASDHIISWSNEGDTVLDPFMGSGTTGVACLETGREFVGIEIDGSYFEMAEKRIQNAELRIQNGAG